MRVRSVWSAQARLFAVASTIVRPVAHEWAKLSAAAPKLFAKSCCAISRRKLESVSAVARPKLRSVRVMLANQLVPASATPASLLEPVLATACASVVNSHVLAVKKQLIACAPA